eukprot:m.963652 g.963652  ORF g.963652 m.963652 type:complete len:711 (-) comp23897_c0_seq4:2494-4626(-)
MSAKGTNTVVYEPPVPGGDGIGVVTLDHYPVNSLSRQVFNECTRAIQRIERDTSVKGIVVVGAGRCFCAGADISAFGKQESEPLVLMGRPVTDMLGFESLSVPVVAAIHGLALGGGLETALGCHYRIIKEDAFVGLPEVNIGLLPGGQGTQRLPRLIGCDAALDFMTTGAHVPAADALKLGIVDKVVTQQESLLDAAKEFCKSKMNLDIPRIVEIRAPAAVDFGAWHARMDRARRGEPAPQAIIRCVEAACNSSKYSDGDTVEKKEFVKLIRSPESAALRYMFFAERAGNKIPGVKTAPKPIRTVGIIGCGLMGGGIAMACAEAGINVVIVDMTDDALSRGMGQIKANFTRSRRLSAAQKEKFLARIHGSTAFDAVRNCDLVVEAVYEDMETKKQVFSRLDKVCKPGAFLCSNTSFLDIDEIASATTRPEYVMGTHFFSPANVMKLLENVRGSRTSDLTIATMMAWGTRIGKWCILVGNCDGFVGNRMIKQYNDAARALLQDGMLPEAVDRVATDFGMRVGPFAMADIVGIDLGIQAVRKAGKYDPQRNVMHALVDAGRLGQKTRAGFYDYDGQRRATPSAAVARIVADVARNNGAGGGTVQLSDDVVLQRLLCPMINEAFSILDEGIAVRPSDIDVCYVHGYSFPRIRGGPMHHADTVGLTAIAAALERMHVTPAPLLLQCIADGVTVHQWHQRQLRSRARTPPAPAKL